MQWQRRSFDQVKQKPRTLSMRYMLLYPAKLKVLHEGKSFFFTSPEEAWQWVTEQLVLRPNPVAPWGSQHSSSDTDVRTGKTSPPKQGRSHSRRARKRANFSSSFAAPSGDGAHLAAPDYAVAHDALPPDSGTPA